MFRRRRPEPTAGERTVSVEDDRRVVVDTRRPPLEDRANHNHRRLARDLGQGLGRRTGDRLGQVEPGGILDLTEVLGAEQLGEAGDLRAATGRPASAHPPR